MVPRLTLASRSHCSLRPPILPAHYPPRSSVRGRPAPPSSSSRTRSSKTPPRYTRRYRPASTSPSYPPTPPHYACSSSSESSYRSLHNQPPAASPPRLDCPLRMLAVPRHLKSASRRDCHGYGSTPV